MLVKHFQVTLGNVFHQALCFRGYVWVCLCPQMCFPVWVEMFISALGWDLSEQKLAKET